MLRLKKMLTEAKQVGTIYHVCSSDSLIYNLTKNCITPGMTANKINGKKTVSFTRDNKFFVDNVKTEFVVFQMVVDGDKLSENKKIQPYADRKYRSTDTSEKEEAVFGEIKNLKKFLRRINVVIFYARYEAMKNKIKKNSIEEILDALNVLKRSSISGDILVLDSVSHPVSVKTEIPNTLNGLISFFTDLNNSLSNSPKKDKRKEDPFDFASFFS